MLTEWLTPHIKTLRSGFLERKTLTFWLITLNFFFFFILAWLDILDSSFPQLTTTFFLFKPYLLMVKKIPTFYSQQHSSNFGSDNKYSHLTPMMLSYLWRKEASGGGGVRRVDGFPAFGGHEFLRWTWPTF